jgi:putative CocE/NonD family hydrolase
LKEDLQVVGPINLILHVSSDAVDTDFYAKICDVFPDGRSFNLQGGVMRMRYRHSLERPTLMKPGEIYRIEIALKTIANTFLKGHRIQLQITSSDFPVHDRNLNTGLNCESTTGIHVADNVVYTGGIYDSQLILPVLAA